MTTLPDHWRSVVPRHWTWTKLHYVAKIGTGHTPDRSKPEYWRDCDIPWVTASDLSSRASAFAPLMDTEQKVSALGVANSAAVVHPSGTVMFCRTASVGLFCIIGTEMATTQAFVTWTPGPRLDARFLLYLIAALRPEFDRNAYGSTHLTIYMPDLEAISVPIPPLEEQRRIADFLDDQVARIDALIAHREMQRALVHERKKSSLSELFRSGSRRRLRSVLTRRPSYGVLVPRLAVGPGVPFVRVGDLSALGDPSRELAEIDSEQSAEYSRTVVQGGDLLLSVVGSLDKAAVAPEWRSGSNIARAVALLRPVTPSVAWALFAWTQTDDYLDQARLSTGGDTAQPTLNMGDLSQFTIRLGDPESVAALAREVQDEARAASLALSRSLALLSEYKRALITAAVTGEFDVATASGRGLPA